MSETVDPPRCGAQHPTWRDPITRCVRPPGHVGKHGHAGVFWADEQPRQRIVIPGTPGVQIDVDGDQFTVTIGTEELARDGQRPNFDRFVPRGPTRDDLLDAWEAYRSQAYLGEGVRTERRAFEAGWYEHQRQTGGGVA